MRRTLDRPKDGPVDEHTFDRATKEWFSAVTDPATPRKAGLVIADEKGARRARWQDAASKGVGGSTGAVVDVSDVRSVDLPTEIKEEVIERERQKLPRYRKRSPQDRARHLMRMMVADLDRMGAVLGRPVTVADLSDQWLQAFKIDALKREGYDLSLAKALTPTHLLRCAQIYLQEIDRKKRGLWREGGVVRKPGFETG
jgi:hypothetical protein